MLPTVIVRGDHLPVLAPLAAAQASADVGARAVVWGVDLGDAVTRAQAHRRLRQLAREIGAHMDGQADLAHVFIAYSHRGRLHTGACVSAAARLASRLHARWERDRGRYVDVVALDVTGCEDGELVRHRVIEAAAGRAGAAGDVALTWDEITDVSIHRAAMQELC